MTNPFGGIEPPKQCKTGGLDRSFLPDEWQTVTTYLRSQYCDPDRGEHVLRLDLIFQLAHATGLRRNEMVTLTCGDFFQERIADKIVWFIRIIGKGEKEREIPLSDGLVDLIEKYFISRKLYPDVRANSASTPIIAKLQIEKFKNETRVFSDNRVTADSV